MSTCSCASNDHTVCFNNYIQKLVDIADPKKELLSSGIYDLNSRVHQLSIRFLACRPNGFFTQAGRREVLVDLDPQTINYADLPNRDEARLELFKERVCRQIHDFDLKDLSQLAQGLSGESAGPRITKVIDAIKPFLPQVNPKELPFISNAHGQAAHQLLDYVFQKQCPSKLSLEEQALFKQVQLAASSAYAQDICEQQSKLLQTQLAGAIKNLAQSNYTNFGRLEIQAHFTNPEGKEIFLNIGS